MVVPDGDAISTLSNNPLTTMHKQVLLKLKATRKHVKGVDKSQEPHRTGQKDNSDGLRIPKKGLPIYARYVGAQIGSSVV